jgi:hypothetical protein
MLVWSVSTGDVWQLFSSAGTLQILILWSVPPVTKRSGVLRVGGNIAIDLIPPACRGSGPEG